MSRFITATNTTLHTDGGVIGGCADLCAFLGNPVEAGVCDLVCDVFGIEEFIKLVQM